MRPHQHHERVWIEPLERVAEGHVRVDGRRARVDDEELCRGPSVVAHPLERFLLVERERRRVEEGDLEAVLLADGRGVDEPQGVVERARARDGGAPVLARKAPVLSLEGRVYEDDLHCLSLSRPGS